MYNDPFACKRILFSLEGPTFELNCDCLQSVFGVLLNGEDDYPMMQSIAVVSKHRMCCLVFCGKLLLW